MFPAKLIPYPTFTSKLKLHFIEISRCSTSQYALIPNGCHRDLKHDHRILNTDMAHAIVIFSVRRISESP